MTTSLTDGEHIYLEPLISSSSTPGSDALIQRYVSSMPKQICNKPEIFNGPNELYGYEASQLFLVAVHNFHNKTGRTYKWYLHAEYQHY